MAWRLESALKVGYMDFARLPSTAFRAGTAQTGKEGASLRYMIALIIMLAMVLLLASDAM
jgi:hypothetical protein